MKLLFENWRQYINEEEEDALELAAANVRKMFTLVKQIEKAHAKAPQEHTSSENLKKQNQIVDQVLEPYYDNIDKLVDQQLALKPGPNFQAEYNKIHQLIGAELRKAPELFAKMFNISKEQNFQFTKEWYEISLRSFKLQLKETQKILAILDIPGVKDWKSASELINSDAFNKMNNWDKTAHILKMPLDQQGKYWKEYYTNKASEKGTKLDKLQTQHDKMKQNLK